MTSRRGVLMILSSPSGAGKTTLARMLCAADPAINMSVSATTRPPRPGEIDGEHYHFLDEGTFSHLRDTDQLLEWAHVFGNLYGTPRAPIEQALRQGGDVLFDVDWQGTQQLYEKMHGELVRVFVLPPSYEELAQRLHNRGQDSKAVVASRMAQAVNEISHWAEYDYVIINRQLDESSKSLQSILAAERLKQTRGTGLSSFVRKIQKGFS